MLFLGPMSEIFKSKIKNLTKLNSLEKNLILGPLEGVLSNSIDLIIHFLFNYFRGNKNTWEDCS